MTSALSRDRHTLGAAKKKAPLRHLVYMRVYMRVMINHLAKPTLPPLVHILKIQMPQISKKQ